MKLLEFKREVNDRLGLLKASLLFTFQRDVAYVGNNWANMLSILVYTGVILLFIDVLYENVDFLAGYSQNEMLFYLFVAQIVFYLNWMINIRNLRNLITDVNRGNLDLVLTKPAPALFYVSSRNISIINTIRDSLPILVIVLSINWGTLNISLVSLSIGAIIMTLGFISISVFQFLSAIPVFWLGESAGIQNLSQHMVSGAGSYIPLEGFPRNIKILLSTFVPILIATGFTVSAILGKSSQANLLIWAFLVAMAALYTRKKIWNLALRNYTSASS